MEPTKEANDDRTYYCSVDGNALCIHGGDFVNLQESNAVFIDLTEEQIKEIGNL